MRNATRRAAIILCGGESGRMGRSKAALAFGPETMLERVAGVLRPLVETIVVVAAKGQKLPDFVAGENLFVVRDRKPGRGPLEGLVSGLTAIAAANDDCADRTLATCQCHPTYSSSLIPHPSFLQPTLARRHPHPPIDAAFVTGCDVPFLAPRFVERMFELLEDREIVVPREGEFHHPLAAVYRPAVAGRAEQLLAAGRFRFADLFVLCDTREVAVDSLRDADPELLTLVNCNRPEDYESALRRAGFSE